MNALPFLLPYLVPTTMILGFITAKLWLFRAVSWIWLIVVVLDFVIRSDFRSCPSEQVDNLNRTLLWRLALRLWVPVQATIILCGLFITTWDFLSMKELLLVTVSIGIAGGMFCIPVAHELMHGVSRFDKILSELLMMSVSYTHFCIEHIDGHHRNVGTANDPATARLGESVYDFFPRTIIGGIISAWTIEEKRLYREGTGVWCFQNRMLRYITSLGIVYALILYMFGWLGMGFFAVQSAIAFSMLEVINYIEHYGLTRREVAPGQYERIAPFHSWDSSHQMSNWMLFNLGHHSDHHYCPRKPFYNLCHIEEAPQLPIGYFGIFLLPLLPPLWRGVMDPRVQAWRSIHGTSSNTDSLK